MNLKDKIEQLMMSGSFDSNWYIEQYPDVVRIGMDPAEHYLRYGKKLGRGSRPRSTLKSKQFINQDIASRETSCSLIDVELKKNSEIIRTSGLFDADWYKNQYSLAGNEIDLILDYLTEGYLKKRNPNPEFDTTFYLEKSPDVARAGMNPLLHYIMHGKNEKRPIKASKVAELDDKLWCGFSKYALNELEAAKSGSVQIKDRVFAMWSLMRWYYVHGEYTEALANITTAHQLDKDTNFDKSWILPEVHCLLEAKEVHKAQGILKAFLDYKEYDADICLAMSNTYLTLTSNGKDKFNADKQCLDWINKIFVQEGFLPICKIDQNRPLGFDNLGVVNHYTVSDSDLPKITVIMPAYNASDKISIAINSLLNQTWSNIEILVVDDCSTDDTFEVVQRIAEKDSRVILIRHTKNQGTYAARNTGLEISSGDFITVHDSDDWSHPQKLEYQMKPLLESKELVGTLSHWTRVRKDLYIIGYWRPKHSWIHWNFSSLLIHKEAQEKLGFWDRVRVGADAEYMSRLESMLGHSSILKVHRNVPLSFALTSDFSLTVKKDTHLKTGYFGLRRIYGEASQWWHRKCKESGHFYLANTDSKRSFPAPLKNLSESQDYSVNIVFIADFAHKSELFELEDMMLILNALVKKCKVAIFHWPKYTLNSERSIEGYIFKLATSYHIGLLTPNAKVSTENILVLQPEVIMWQLDGVPSIKSERVLVLSKNKSKNNIKNNYELKKINSTLQDCFAKQGKLIKIYELKAHWGIV